MAAINSSSGSLRENQVKESFDEDDLAGLILSEDLKQIEAAPQPKRKAPLSFADVSPVQQESGRL